MDISYLKYLIPKAEGWVTAEERRILASGVPLYKKQREDVAKLGIENINVIRFLSSYALY